MRIRFFYIIKRLESFLQPEYNKSITKECNFIFKGNTSCLSRIAKNQFVDEIILLLFSLMYWYFDDFGLKKLASGHFY